MTPQILTIILATGGILVATSMWMLGASNLSPKLIVALAVVILVALATGCGTLHGLVAGAGQLASGIGADLTDASRGLATSTRSAGGRFAGDDGGELERYDERGLVYRRGDVLNGRPQ